MNRPVLATHFRTLAAIIALGLLQIVGAADTQAQGPEAGPRFTPFTVAPSLLNLDEVREALIRAYPVELREAGIGGRVNVWFYIDDEGRIQRTLIDVSSGHEALDEAAMNVAAVYRFSPAMNREERVAVWVSLPITFAVR